MRFIFPVPAFVLCSGAASLLTLAALAPLAAATQAAHAERVTFTKDIAPILFERCSACHHPDGVAPFSLITYADARRRASLIALVTRNRLMPPWKSEPGFGDFVGQQHLSAAEIDRIQQWAAAGAPEGDQQDLPPAPHWIAGWQLGKPDLVVALPEVDGQNTQDLNNPNIMNRRGPQPGEVPVNVKIAGVYEFPYGLRAGTSMIYIAGTPLLTTVRVGSDTFKLNQGSQTLTVEPFGTAKNANTTMVDFDIAKTFRVGRMRIEPRMDVFNALNAGVITNSIPLLGPTYGAPISFLPARLIKFGFNLQF